MVHPENPIGIIQIDHLEFTCDQLETPTKDLFYRLGFSKNYENKTTSSELFAQGQIRFILTANQDEQSQSCRPVAISYVCIGLGFKRYLSSE